MTGFDIREVDPGAYPDAVAVISHCLYQPDTEKLAAVARQYSAEGRMKLLGCFVDGHAVGVAGVDLTEPDRTVLLHLSVTPDLRGQGTGRILVEALFDRYPIRSLEAETDGDAVGFYRNCGFSVTSLGEKYPGVIRFRCMRGEA